MPCSSEQRLLLSCACYPSPSVLHSAGLTRLNDRRRVPPTHLPLAVVPTLLRCSSPRLPSNRVLINEQTGSDPSLMFPLGAADPALCTFLHDAFSLYFAAIPNYMNISGAGYGAGTIIPSELEGGGRARGWAMGLAPQRVSSRVEQGAANLRLSLCTAMCSAHAPWLLCTAAQTAHALPLLAQAPWRRLSPLKPRPSRRQQSASSSKARAHWPGWPRPSTR